MFCRKTVLLAAVTMMAAASPAFGLPRIVASTPTVNGTAAKLSRIDLTFDEKLIQAPVVALSMTSMPGMAHHSPMKIAGFKVTVSPNGLTATLALPRTLPAGTYNLAWKAKSASGEGNGAIVFTAK